MTILADAITPLTHFFQRETLLPNSILFAFIVLLEAWLLKKFVKSMPFKKHLLYSFLINLSSSVIGSLVFWLANASSPFPYMSCGFIVVLFVLTLVVEYPLIACAYRNVLPGERIINVDLSLNAISYALSIVIGFAFIIGILTYEADRDWRRLTEWVHPEVFAQESGTIYAVLFDEDSKSYCLKSYSIETGAWIVADFNVPDTWLQDVPGSQWDISDDSEFIACTGMEKIETPGSTQDFSSIFDGSASNVFTEKERVEIYRDSDATSVFNILGEFVAVDVDPTGEYVALLEHRGYAASKRSTSSYYSYGVKCRLLIYSIEGYKSLSTYEHPVLMGGLCWSPDSRKVLFVSLRDKDLLASDERQLHRASTEYSGFKAHPRYIYMYDIETATTTELCEGRMPQWSHDGKKIAFINDTSICIYDFNTGQVEVLCKRQGMVGPHWSLTDRCIIGVYPPQSMLGGFNRLLVVMPIENPELKHVIGKQVDGDIVVWIE